MSEDAPVLFDATRSGVAVITLNRPATRNALNPDVIARLSEIVEELKGADGVRVVLVEGAGENFSAGPDPEWLRFSADYTHADDLADGRGFARLLHRLRHLPMPTVALVDGQATGSAVGLVAACDIVLATSGARFALDEVRRGVLPAVASPYVGERVGLGALRRLALTGAAISAEEAARLGLVDELVADRAALAAASERLVSGIFESAPGAVAEMKDLIGRLAHMPLDAKLEQEVARAHADARAKGEAKEGLAALMEARRPRWAE
ncbi:MAG: enoyl-CoA hydratase/isomerase family protein [Alphaproteobacteria bacterium]|nr:enoyl-CoA hydratase/isomerase family protein [Alphaproteobacteria bacterium]